MEEGTSNLLRASLTDEALRRMCRKANAKSVVQKGPLELNDSIRAIANIMLTQLTEKIIIFTDYKRLKIITDETVKLALEQLNVSSDYYPAPNEDAVFELCDTFRSAVQAKAKAKAKAKARRGATAEDEVQFEQNNQDCLYMEKIPFARLFRHYLHNRLDLKITASAISWIQITIETLLVKLIHFTSDLVENMSKGQGEKGKPRAAINSRDFYACAENFKRCSNWAILRGTLQYLKPKGKKEAKPRKESKPKEAKPPKETKSRSTGRGGGKRGGSRKRN